MKKIINLISLSAYIIGITIILLSLFYENDIILFLGFISIGVLLIYLSLFLKIRTRFEKNI